MHPTPRGRRARILAAAARLFRTQGFERTTVRQIADAVGLQSGSLFHHFKSKEAILLAVMEDGVRQAIAAADRVLAAARTPPERFRALVRAHLETLLGPAKDALAVLLYEWRALSPAAQARLIALRDAYEARWQQVLDELAREGRAPQDTRLYRRYLLGALNWAHEWYRPNGDLSVAELAERFAAFTLGEAPQGG